MRIHLIEVQNFKKFAKQSFGLHRQFTLLVGENGSGKTSVLDALSVALGVWLARVPDSSLANSRRPIYSFEKRLEWVRTGDRSLFQEANGEVSVRAIGCIENHDDVTWEQYIGIGKQRASTARAKDALKIIENAYDLAQSGERVLLPVIGYYGAGRAWLPHRERSKVKAKSKPNGVASRWAAFYDCLNERIRLADLTGWFQGEAIAAVNLGGKFRPGFEVVKRAVLRCVPDSDGMWYDGDRNEIVLSIAGNAQPFGNLSAGQRMMLALVADIAIKAVTQNNYLVPPDALNSDGALPRVLAETPGVVLIDELDVHLHPRWQRRVATDLKATFPNIQFVCTSHSPQVIGEVPPGEIRLLDQHQVGRTPAHSYGVDSNAILEEIMGAESMSVESRQAIEGVEVALDNGDLDAARSGLDNLRRLQFGETRDTTRLEATINNLEALTNAGD